MFAFDFYRPDTLAEAVSALRRMNDPKLLAGGMTLIPTLKQRLAQPSDLIDLSGISGLEGIREEAGAVVIGAMTCHADVAASLLVQQKLPGLAKLASLIGDPQVRNRGTIGGSIANNDPAADYPAGIVGLDATIETDRRELAAADFFTGMFETALEPDEIIVSIRIAPPRRSAYRKFANPISRYAMAGVFVAETALGLIVAVTGAGPCVFRVTEMEEALARSFSPEVVTDIVIPEDGLNNDMHGSAAYRAHLVKVMASRAIFDCCGDMK